MSIVTKPGEIGMDSNRKVAVITGAASGIGLAFTKICLQNNMSVVMADKDVTELCDQVELLASEYESDIYGVVTDVTSIDSVNQLAKQTMEHFGRVDWLFNNAGISGHLAPIWQQPLAHIRTILDVNLHGIIHGIQAFIPIMLKQSKDCKIINMASMYGLFSGSHVGAYAMSKSAIVSLSESLYFDLKRVSHSIAVSVVCPSFVDTGLLSNSAPVHCDPIYEKLTDVLAFSRSADEVAQDIFSAVEAGQFYVFPDAEVKTYTEDRMKAILADSTPHANAIEKLVTQLSDRATTP